MNFLKKNRPGYWIDPVMPGTNIIRPFVVVHPHGSGRFIGACKNNNGLYDFYLVTGMLDKEIVLKNVDEKTNIKVPDNLIALLTVQGAILVNVDEYGETHQNFFGDTTQSRLLAQKLDNAEEEKAALRFLTHEKEGTTFADIAAENRATAMGRLMRKARGLNALESLRTSREPLPEEMSGEGEY